MSAGHSMLFERAPCSQGSLTDSQGSFASITSNTSSVIGAPRLLSSSSNFSSSATTNTQLTSPDSSVGAFSQFRHVQQPGTPSKSREPILPPRLETNFNQAPRDLISTASTSSSEGASTITSPMSAEPQSLTQGSKRTASQAFKPSGTTTMESPRRTAGRGHSRHMSLDSNVSNLSAQLKTRLSYAMVKVQHGWEQQSLDELEEQTSRKASPVAAARAGDRIGFSDSPQSYSRRRRFSTHSDNPDHYLASPRSQISPPGYSRSLNSTPAVWSNDNPVLVSTNRNLQALSNESGHSLASGISYTNGPGLAPAAPIVSGRPRRSNSTRSPPSLLSTQRAGQSLSDLGPGARIPTTPRAGILRMPSQQAEKDAVDTLLFMSSPNNSTYVGHTANSTTQPSPLRTEFNMAPKRVVFEEDNPKMMMHEPIRSFPNGKPEFMNAPTIPQLAAKLMTPPSLVKGYPQQQSPR